MKLSNTIAQKLFGSLLAAMLGLLSISAAHAQILLFSNLADEPQGEGLLSLTLASPFMTGANISTVTSLTTNLQGLSATSSQFTADIYSNSSKPLLARGVVCRRFDSRDLSIWSLYGYEQRNKFKSQYGILAGFSVY